MKKILLFAFSIFALAIVFSACEEKEDPFYTGVTIYIDKLHFYPLDASYQGNIEVSKTEVTKLTVFKTATEIATATISGGKGQFSVPRSGLSEVDTIGNKTTLNFQVDGPDGLASRNLSVSLKDPVTITGLKNLAPMDTTIKVAFKINDDCTAPATVVVTRALNSEDPVVVATEGTLTDGWIDVVVTPGMNKDTLHFAITSANENGSVVSKHMLIIAEQRDWNFEEYDSFVTEFAPWTLEDKDGFPTYTFSALSYPGAGNPGSWIIFDTEASDPAGVAGWEAHSGTKFAMCADAVPDGDNGNNDWMTSKPFAIATGQSVSFYARSVTDSYGLERFIVKVLVPETKAEIVLTPDPYKEAPVAWTNFKFDLSEFDGKTVQIMIGCVSYDAFALFIDDFEILDADGKSLYSNSFQTSTSVPVNIEKVK